MSRITIVLIAILTVAAVFQIEELRLTTARSHAATALLAATNAEAARDSTRDVSAVLDDSLHTVEKRAIQAQLHGDALDHALHQERIARTALSATVDSLALVAHAASGPIDSADTRRAHFDLRRPPYTLAVDAALPPPPDSAHVDVTVALDPLALDVRVACASADPAGMRAASVDVSGPSWARVTLGHVEQSPALCNSPLLTAPARSFGVHLAPFVLGVGAVLQSNGPRGLGLFAGTGLVLGRL